MGHIEASSIEELWTQRKRGSLLRRFTTLECIKKLVQHKASLKGRRLENSKVWPWKSIWMACSLVHSTEKLISMLWKYKESNALRPKKLYHKYILCFSSCVFLIAAINKSIWTYNKNASTYCYNKMNVRFRFLMFVVA